MREIDETRVKVVIIIFLVGIFFHFRPTKERALKREAEYLSRFKETEIVVSLGDTSWDIQRRLAPGEDVFRLLYYAKETNGKDMGKIKPNETLIFLEKIK